MALEWEEDESTPGNWSTEYRPNHSGTIDVLCCPGLSHVLFEPIVPDVETGKELADVLVEAERKFRAEHGY